MTIYAVTIFLSAFLLFQLQLVIAKIILPWFGGSAAVWTTCVLFFQTVLLLGYLYAHWSIRFLGARKQFLVHAALLTLSLLALPVTPASHWKPSGPDDPVPRILALLSVSAGLPYFLLSTTSPLLQAWYSRTYREAFPYRLFALSNAGSMLGLLSYPVLFEPLLTVRMQSWTWSAAYLAFALMCGTAAFRSRETQGAPAGAREGGAAPAWGTWSLWVALPACASAFFLSVTNHLTQNVAPIPFLWVLPLALYLLSFMLCFSGKRRYRRRLYLFLLPAAAAAMSVLLVKGMANAPLAVMIPVFAGGLFVCCMVCHGELMRLAPHPRHLTSYYLMISLGGAVGGLFVGLLAPAVFYGYFEMPASLAACVILGGAAVFRDLAMRPGTSLLHKAWIVLFSLFGVALAGFLFLLASFWGHGSRVTARNFYGVLQVNDTGEIEGLGNLRALAHGTIIHGRQFLRPDLRKRPTGYYVPDSGVGLALTRRERNAPMRVGIIGLGAGTLACYGSAGDTFRFYEINPLVISIAGSEFTFLGDSEAAIEVVPGDARLSLEREPGQAFDLLVVDAFSSDSIPVHLLTREAFLLYSRHLKENGTIAVHITNLYLDLAPVVRRMADELGKEALLVTRKEGGGPDAGKYSAWVLVSGNRRFLEDPVVRKAGRPLPAAEDRHAWTDDYSNLFLVLNRSENR